MTKLDGKHLNDDLNVRPENYKFYQDYKESLKDKYQMLGCILNCIENDGPTVSINDKDKIDYTKLPNEDLIRAVKDHEHEIDWLDDFRFPRKTTREFLRDIHYIENELYDFEEYVFKVNVIINSLKYQCSNTTVRFTATPYEDSYNSSRYKLKTLIEIIIPQGGNFFTKLSFSI